MTHAYRIYAPPGETGETTESAENSLHTQFNGRRTNEEKSLQNRAYPPNADEVHAPESGTPAGEATTETDSIDHRYGLYRFDSDADPIRILNEIDNQLLGDEPWAVIDYHQCAHGDPTRVACSKWERRITRGPVPDSLARRQFRQ